MIPLLLVFASTIGIYLFLILGFRFLGQRQLGQLTPLDLVIIVIMGSAVETAMVHGNTSLGAGLVSASALLMVNFIIGRLSNENRRIGHLLGGGVKLLVHHGHPVIENMKRLGFTMDDLMSAIRQRGYDSLDDISYATFEEDGEITVVAKSSKKLTIPASDVPKPEEPEAAESQAGS